MFIQASSYVQFTNFPTSFDVRVCCGACCNCCRLLASLFVSSRLTLHRPVRMQAFEAAMDAGAEDVQRVEGEDDATEGYKARSLEAFLRLVCGIACCPVPWMQADVRSMSNFDVAACSCGLFRDSCSASQGDTRREGSWCFTHWWLLSVVAVSAMPWCSGADKRRRVRIGTRQPASARHPGSRRPVRAGVLAPHCHRGALTSSSS